MATDPGSGIRETWNTRAAFVLAAIGSAVGLGNLWGFPYKLYAFGGGAFLIPYFIAMAVMGIPLLIMEFAVGHWAQTGPPDAFHKVCGKYRFVGWWLVTLAFVIITYYTVILGYCVIYLVESVAGMVGKDLPWSVGQDAAANHFFGEILDYKEGFGLTGIRGNVMIGMVVSWVMIYLCLFRGVKWVSKVVLLTVPLPWIMLMILTFRGLTLPGAVTGLQFYLEPHWEKLGEVDTWRWAFGQVFFSMSLGFAVMLSYASFLHRRSDLNNNALVIGLGDLGTSFIAGIAVFSTLGAMAMADNVAVENVVAKGPGLAFVTFPYALSRLPAAQAMFSAVFFVALLTLGIDSAFSIVEACLVSVCDSKQKWPRTYVLPAICLIGLTIGLVYCCGGGGLNFLGFVDDLINGPMGILVVALAECLVVGWAWKGRFVVEMREHANERSDWQLGRWWDITVKYVAPAFLIILIVWSVADFVYEKNMLMLMGSGLFMLIPVIFLVWCKPKDEEDEAHRDDGDTLKLLLGVPLASVLLGVAVGAVRLVMDSGKAAAEAAEQGGEFVARELGATAYIILASALAVVFGGLIWCFWKALQAAGRRDPDMESEQV